MLSDLKFRYLLMVLPVFCFGLLITSVCLPNTIDPATSKMADAAVNWHMACFNVGLLSLLPALFSYRLFARYFSFKGAFLGWFVSFGSLVFMLCYMISTGVRARGWLD